MDKLLYCEIISTSVVLLNYVIGRQLVTSYVHMQWRNKRLTLSGVIESYRKLTILCFKAPWSWRWRLMSKTGYYFFFSNSNLVKYNINLEANHFFFFKKQYFSSILSCTAKNKIYPNYSRFILDIRFLVEGARLVFSYFSS